jgi:DUF1680 family protein
MNARAALPYQWRRYEEAGTIENFRIAAGKKKGQRRGFFYTDSDLHKWADAAARALAVKPDKKLAAMLAEYITSLKKRAKRRLSVHLQPDSLSGNRWKICRSNTSCIAWAILSKQG